MRTWRLQETLPNDRPLHLSPQQAVDSHSVEASPPTPFWFDWKTRPRPTTYRGVCDECPSGRPGCTFHLLRLGWGRCR